MRRYALRKLIHRRRQLRERLWEVVIVTALLPALAHAVASTFRASRAEAATVQVEPTPGLFDRNEPLDVALYADLQALCRDPDRKDCADLPAKLVNKTVQVALHTRGRFRSTGGCDLPALFVYFGADTIGTLFAGEKMLPLTTHCRKSTQYEQYVVKEYLAYRIYNALTDKSLRARLVRVTYHDSSSRAAPLVRYAFFTEHFDSLARRNDAAVFKPEQFDLQQADANELATMDLFEYMIGNTDWSAVYRHNVVLIRDAAGRPTAVPYDFDFAGLVDAEYAVVAPKLPIHDVKQRLFRGVCRSDTDWEGVFAAFVERRAAIYRLLDERALDQAARAQTRHYLDYFFAVLDSPSRRDREVVTACRGPR
jgi:hypothetical protein